MQPRATAKLRPCRHERQRSSVHACCRERQRSSVQVCCVCYVSSVHHDFHVTSSFIKRRTDHIKCTPFSSLEANKLSTYQYVRRAKYLVFCFQLLLYLRVRSLILYCCTPTNGQRREYLCADMLYRQYAIFDLWDTAVFDALHSRRRDPKTAPVSVSPPTSWPSTPRLPPNHPCQTSQCKGIFLCWILTTMACILLHYCLYIK